MRLPARSVVALATIVASLQLVACGGGSGSSSVSTTTLSGRAVAGAVTGTVIVSDAGKEVASGAVTGGAFSIKVPDSALSHELDFVVTGSYADEVSGGTVTLAAAHPLALRIAAGTITAGTAASFGITPETTVIRQLAAAQGMTLANAHAAYLAALGHDTDGTALPYDPGAAAPASPSAGEQDAAFRVGAYSQFGSDLGLSGDDLAALPTALAADLADGSLDGLDGSGNHVTIGSVDLRTLHQASMLASRYMVAMATFAGSPANVAAVPAPGAGLPPNEKITEAITNMTAAERVVTLSDGTTHVRVSVKLAGSAPFSTMGPTTARTTYKITLTDADTGNAIDLTSGPVASVSIGSLMHMLGMSHGTPRYASYESNSTPSSGVLYYSVYYVMASAMSMGGTMVPMGIWDLDVNLDDGSAVSTARFHPNVTMPMSGTLVSKPNDALDPTNRRYWVWLDSVAANGGGGYDVGVYLSTKVGMMFPSVVAGLTLSDIAGSPSISAVAVQFSTDGVNWTTATATGGGRYAATGLTGITSGSAANLTVKVTVTVDGTDHSLLLSGADPQLGFTAP